MITRIPITDAQTRLTEIVAGMVPGDEIILVNRDSSVAARLLPGQSVESEDADQPAESESEWKQALRELASLYKGPATDVLIDRGSIYE
ncbi:hypothetical protein [Lacunimicrobium album]